MDYMNVGVNLWRRIIHDYSSYAVMLHAHGQRSIQFDFPDSYLGFDALLEMYLWWIAIE